MKRVTLLMKDEMYTSLLDYASVRSRTEIRRVSMGEIIREFISKESKLERSGPDVKIAPSHKQSFHQHEMVRDSVPRTA